MSDNQHTIIALLMILTVFLSFGYSIYTEMRLEEQKVAAYSEKQERLLEFLEETRSNNNCTTPPN